MKHELAIKTEWGALIICCGHAILISPDGDQLEVDAHLVLELLKQEQLTQSPRRAQNPKKKRTNK